MRALTLNIRHGGGSRVNRLAEYLARQEADILVVTEYREGKGLASLLTDAGYHFQYSGTGKPNTVHIASRVQGTAKTFEAQRLIGYTINGLAVLGTYFAGKEQKRPLFEYLLANPPESPSLLIGDFNTGEHYKDEHGKSFYCADLFVDLQSIGWHRQNSHEPSWTSNAGNGFCIDHAFTTADIKATASYDHAPRLNKLTDHSALSITLEL